MAILTKSDRAAIAASIKQQPIHLTWGTGDTTWESTYTVTKTFASNKIELDNKSVKKICLNYSR